MKTLKWNRTSEAPLFYINPSPLPEYKPKYLQRMLFHYNLHSFREINPWNCVLKNGVQVFPDSPAVRPLDDQQHHHCQTTFQSNSLAPCAFNSHSFPAALTLICLNSSWAHLFCSLVPVVYAVGRCRVLPHLT